MTEKVDTLCFSWRRWQQSPLTVGASCPLKNHRPEKRHLEVHYNHKTKTLEKTEINGNASDMGIVKLLSQTSDRKLAWKFQHSLHLKCLLSASEDVQMPTCYGLTWLCLSNYFWLFLQSAGSQIDLCLAPGSTRGMVIMSTGSRMTTEHCVGRIYCS